jgi:hypothetical protein
MPGGDRCRGIFARPIGRLRHPRAESFLPFMAGLSGSLSCDLVRRALISKKEDRMVRFQPSILFVVLTVLTGCSAQLERSKEQEPNRVEQKEEQTPSSVPTFRYRPGAGLTIEGR